MPPPKRKCQCQIASHKTHRLIHHTYMMGVPSFVLMYCYSLKRIIGSGGGGGGGGNHVIIKNTPAVLWSSRNSCHAAKSRYVHSSGLVANQQNLEPKAHLALSASRLAHMSPGGTVFSEFTRLANEYSSINLGQGFPTIPVAPFILEAAAKCFLEDSCMMHQYARSEGHPRLVRALANHYASRLGRRLDGMTEIIPTIGACQAIYAAVHAFINPGDEVIIIQPFYDSYPASIRLAGGIPVVVNLSPPSHGANSNQSHPITSQDWKVDMGALRRAVTSRTRMLILNNPHNPVGKVFSRDELQEIASFAEANNLLVIADEVYESLTYEQKYPLIKFASLPGMYERTITVGSAGKMFGVTGWKIGWVIAPPSLTRSIWLVHQFVCFCVPTPLQEAVAIALEQAESHDFFSLQQKLYRSKRDALFSTLDAVSLSPILPAGGYFIMADTSTLLRDRVSKILPLAPPLSHPRKDYEICRYLTVYAGVTAIPPSAFYDPQDEEAIARVAERFARFAFCKDDEALGRAAALLRKHLLPPS